MASRESKDKTSKATEEQATTYFLDEASNLSVIMTKSSGAFEADLYKPRLVDTSSPNNKATGAIDDRWISICHQQKIFRTRLDSKTSGDENTRITEHFLSLFEPEQRDPLLAIIDLAKLFRHYKFNQAELGGFKLGPETRFILHGLNHLLSVIKWKLFPETARQWFEQRNEKPDLHNQILSSLDAIKGFCSKKNISLNNKIMPGITRSLAVEKANVQPILQNVLFNAVQCTQHGETISLTYKHISSSHIHLQLRSPGTPCASTIAGSTSFLRQPFNRISLNTYMLEGSGIGLIIASKLIEFLGGGFSVNFRQETGNVFDIILPVREKVLPAALGVTTSGKAAAQGSHKVLYIEDNESHIQLLAHILKKFPALGFLSAVNPEDGLGMALQERPDLIILDIRLNGMDGFEVLRQLRADSRTADIPVVALSAAAMTHEVEKGLSMGFDHYLTKPFHIADFIRILKKELPDIPVSENRNL